MTFCFCLPGDFTEHRGCLWISSFCLLKEPNCFPGSLPCRGVSSWKHSKLLEWGTQRFLGPQQALWHLPPSLSASPWSWFPTWGTWSPGWRACLIGTTQGLLNRQSPRPGKARTKANEAVIMLKTIMVFLWELLTQPPEEVINHQEESLCTVFIKRNSQLVQSCLCQVRGVDTSSLSPGVSNSQLSEFFFWRRCLGAGCSFYG